MPRTDGRIEKGQSLRSAISARAWNRAQEAADVVLGVTPSVVGGISVPAALASNIILVKNECSPQRTIEIGHVMEIDYYENTPEFDEEWDDQPSTTASSKRIKQAYSQPVVRGRVPGANFGTNQIAVALEPIPHNKIGRCAIGGVVLVRAVRLSTQVPGTLGAVNGITHRVADAVCGPLRLLGPLGSEGTTGWALAVFQ